MTRRETPTRHGRAADALIATYVRELLAEDKLGPLPATHAAAATAPTPAAVETADATR